MAPLAIIFGSTIGALGGFLAWLVAGAGAGTAFAIYLGCSLGLPLLLLVVAGLFGPAPEPAVEMHGDDPEALAA